MTYLVVENHKSYSIVLDEAGRFLRVANMGCEIGDTVEDIYLMEKDKEKQKINIKTISILGTVAASILILVAVLVNSFFASSGDPYATLYMDINPSISISVTEDGKVVGVTGKNSDGNDLVEDYKWKKKDLENVANELVDRAILNGFLNEGGTVNINIDSPDQEWFSVTGVALRQSLNEYLAQRLSVTIKIGDYNRAGDTKTTAGTTEESEETRTTTRSDVTTATTKSEQQKPKETPPTTTKPTKTQAKKRLSEDEVLAIALRHAGLKRADVTIDDLELDEDDGRLIYEIELDRVDDTYDYKFEIDAYTGEILDYKADKND